MDNQPNFSIGNSQAVPGSQFDNLSDTELQKLINEAHRLKTGRTGRVHSAAPPPQKQVVNLERFLGGL